MMNVKIKSDTNPRKNPSPDEMYLKKPHTFYQIFFCRNLVFLLTFLNFQGHFQPNKELTKEVFE